MNKLWLGLLLVSQWQNVAAAFWPFSAGDDAIEKAVADQKLEFQVATALLRDETAREQAHLRVLSFDGILLIAGEAASQAALESVEAVVLEEAGVERVAGDLSRARPRNEQVCDERRHGLYNERRKFNLKNSESCSSVSHVYNKLQLKPMRSAAARAADGIVSARVRAVLAEHGVLEQQHLARLKVVNFDGVVYLFGVADAEPEQILHWTETVDGVRQVIPLWVGP